MKKTFLILLAVQLFFACNNNKKEEKQSVKQETIDVRKEDSEDGNVTTTEQKFDINTIPLSTEDIGDFPFFTAPEGAKYINNPKVKDFDFIVFVTPDRIFEVEGKTFRSHVHRDKESNVEISGRYLNKSFEDAILKAGGVKVFEGNLTKEQKEKYKELATYAGSNGSLDIWNDAVAMYVIRRNDGNVYIAMLKTTGNSTSIQIVQEKAFEQTIQKVTSAKIEKDLLNDGKSVLHINFDTDKATLKSDGSETVQEIIKVLNKNPDLKIAINGYTDNTGSKEHNQKLSENRALTVKNEIIKAGINKDRLTSKGFGQDNPIAGNDTEDRKSQNRRVELIKL
ncbi:MAG: OmpA family protein [Sphingobacteriaceae bacterium]